MGQWRKGGIARWMSGDGTTVVPKKELQIIPNSSDSQCTQRSVLLEDKSTMP